MNHDISSIVQGYAQGYFLMANDDNRSVGWYSSRSRAIVPLDHRFHYPKSLRRSLNQGRFEVAINRDFDAVIEGCADRDSTWICDELKQIYRSLHEAGWAHSFETWQGNQLAGGVLGLCIGGAFIGESMFYHIPEGSKVAMVKLVEHLRNQGFTLFDAQLQNPHLARFGAYTIDDEEYDQRLDEAVALSRSFVPNIRASSPASTT